jgi:hypothetical protein
MKRLPPKKPKKPPGFDKALINMVRAIRLLNKRNPAGRYTFALSWEPYSRPTHEMSMAPELTQDERIKLQTRVRELERALTWYQNQHTLHFSLELLYCVDHYELSKVGESERVIWVTSGETLLECIKAASQSDASDE